MRPSCDQILTRTMDGLSTWPSTRSSRRSSARRSPRSTPSVRPADSTRRPCVWTCSRVLRSASRVVTERSAKKPPTTTTTIATRVPATKRATAEVVLGGSARASGMGRSSLTHGPSGHPTYVALRAGPAQADSDAMTTPRLFTIGLVASVAALAPTATAVAKHGGDDASARGTCSKGSTSKLKVTRDDNRLESEFEVDQNRSGVRWKVVLRRNGRLVVSTTKTTRAPSGSFELRRLLTDGPGTDRITAKATSPSGETCTATTTA